MINIIVVNYNTTIQENCKVMETIQHYSQMKVKIQMIST